MAGRKPHKPKYTYTSGKRGFGRHGEASGQKLNGGTGDKQSGILPIVTCLAIITFICSIAFTIAVFIYVRNLSDLRRSNNSLRVTKLDMKRLSAFDAEMRETNPDYLCWIKIEGTKVDYPVVRGNDNEKYLHTSFQGDENIFGSLFMDYRCAGEYVPHIIIYGHNSRHGDMFGGLRSFLDAQYLSEHPIITLKINERIVEYEIFSARKTDVSDPAFCLDFNASGSFKAFAEDCGAPSDTAQILTLSTCVSGDDEDERVIVQGLLRDDVDSSNAPNG